MRKRFSIIVDIDTDDNSSRSGMQVAGTDKFEVRVRRDTIDDYPQKHAIPITVCHELGHVIGYSFDLPRSSKDPRNILSPRFNIISAIAGCMGIGSRDEIGRKVIDAEKEAWDFAEVIVEMKKFRSEALSTYLEAWGLNDID